MISVMHDIPLGSCMVLLVRLLAGVGDCHWSKSVLVATKLLSRQAYFCCDKHTFVATSILLLRQAYFCCDKHTFVATSILLLRQAYFCCDKHTFVATSLLLLRQAYFCCDKHTFVATKDGLCPAPSNDLHCLAGHGVGRCVNSDCTVLLVTVSAGVSTVTALSCWSRCRQVCQQ